MTLSRNETARESRGRDLDTDKSQAAASRPDESDSQSPGAQPESAREAQSWVFAFILFLLGFLLLVVMAKLKISRFTADVLRGLAAALCVAAFLIARRGQKVAR